MKSKRIKNPDSPSGTGRSAEHTKQSCDADLGSVATYGKGRRSAQHFDVSFHPEVEARLLKYSEEELTRPEVIIAVALRRYLAGEDYFGEGDF
jgi:hypothetical protein